MTFIANAVHVFSKKGISMSCLPLYSLLPKGRHSGAHFR